MRTSTRWVIPTPDEEPWPTLGPEVCDFIEAKLVHGPGDLLGEDVHLTDEERVFIWRAYEVFPKDHPRAGRRRFKRAAYSRRKGVGKTELAQFLAIVEMDPEGPVRCDGWRRQGRAWIPVGRPVRDPFIPMVSTTREQVEGLAYGGVKAILEQTRCALVNDYQTSEEKITHVHAPGEMVALASAPSARDGARTSWQHFDETWLFNTERLRGAHSTMLLNVPKRLVADAWSLETFTAFIPGDGSVAEDTHDYAVAIEEGSVVDGELLYDHRQADDALDLDDADQRRTAILQATGDAGAYTDVEAIVGLWANPKADRNELIRKYTNRPARRSLSWIDIGRWDAHRHPEGLEMPPEDDELEVVLAFDGSYSRDSTALIGATIAARPHVFEVKVWERPHGDERWRTPRHQVDAELDAAMGRWRVVELAPDPPGWHRQIEDWELAYGEVVVRFETKQPRLMGPACELLFNSVMGDGGDPELEAVEFTHDGSQVIRRHLQNAVPVIRLGHVIITKDESDSPRKIDAAVGAVVALARAVWWWNHDANYDVLDSVL